MKTLKVGDRVTISPELTRKEDWVEGNVTEITSKPYWGGVIYVRTDDGEVFFGKSDYFFPAAIMAVGDRVLASEDVTHKPGWLPGTVIQVENNPFNGIVISMETDDGDIFFHKQECFKPFDTETKQNTSTQVRHF